MKPTLEDIQEAKAWTDKRSVEHYALTLAEQVAKGEVVVVPRDALLTLAPFERVCGPSNSRLNPAAGQYVCFNENWAVSKSGKTTLDITKAIEALNNAAQTLQEALNDK